VPKLSIKKLLPYIWLVLPLATLVLVAQTAYRKSLNAEEYAYACDQFGYLRMAKEIRQAVSQTKAPEFKLESDQTRQLIEFMKSNHVPLPKWEEVVAPHAHHYFPESDAVGVQYPPGTGLTLAIFPEGRAIYDLNRVVVVVLTLAGVLALVVAGWKRAWTSAALAILGAQIGLSILARVNTISFSINASLVPLLLSVLITLAALRLRNLDRQRSAWLTALAGGAVLGFAVLIRITTILLVPGLLVLLWPKSRPFRFSNPVLPLALALLVVGVVPVLWHQKQIAGAWYLPTYGRIDATPPTISRIEHHLSYYFGDEFAAQDNWAILLAAIGFAGFVILIGKTTNVHGENGFGLSWKRLGLAALVLWILPTVFFLSHAVQGFHYAMPTTFAVVTLIGFGSLAIEATGKRAPDRAGKLRLRWLMGCALVVIAALGGLTHAWRERTAIPAPAQPLVHVEAPLPAELSDNKSWIWADLLTGTLWYYHQKAAFKISFTDPDVRAMIFRFVFERGEQQYLIRDSETMEQFMSEASQLGGTLEQRGTINGQPYFLIHWPRNGPALKSQPNRVVAD
jgi:hypothetical protein